MLKYARKAYKNRNKRNLFAYFPPYGASRHASQNGARRNVLLRCVVCMACLIYVAKWLPQPLGNVRYQQAYFLSQNGLVGVLWAQPICKRIKLGGPCIGMLQAGSHSCKPVGVIFTHPVHLTKAMRARSLCSYAAQHAGVLQPLPKSLPCYVLLSILRRWNNIRIFVPT